MSELLMFLKSEPNIASAIAALAGVAVATFALIISIISLVVSFVTLKRQHKHNVLSVSPIPEVTIADYEDSLRVRLRNNGSGPMIIKSILVTDGSSHKPTLVDWMPILPNDRLWNHFSTDLVDRSLQPGRQIPLLELSAFEGESNFGLYRDIYRKSINVLTIEVVCTDIYGTEFPTYSKSMNWFARN